MRRLLCIAILIAGLALAPAAAAKQIQSVTVCGGDGCESSHATVLLQAMEDIGPPSDPPSHAVPFYRVTVRVGAGSKTVGRFRAWWAPAAGRLLGDDGTWMTVRPEIRRGLARLSRTLAPLPADRLPGITAADAGTKAPAPAPAEPASSGSDVPVLPLLAGLTALVLAGLALALRARRPRGGLA